MEPRSRSLFLAACVTLGQVAAAQSFQTDLGVSKYEEGLAVKTTGSNIVAVVRHFREGLGHALQVVRTNLNGGSSVRLDVVVDGAVFPQNAIPTTDGWVVCGSLIRPGEHEQNALVLRVSDFGVVQWVWVAPTDGVEEQLLGITGSGEGYVACGMRRSSDSTNSDVLFVRVEADGTPTWITDHGTVLDEKAWDIACDAGGCVAVGRTNTYTNDADALAMRIHPDGALVWQETWGGEGNDEAHATTALADGTFAWAGYTESYPPGDTTAAGQRFCHSWCMRINQNADTLWSRTFGDTLMDHTAQDIALLPNGDLLLGGQRGIPRRTDAIAQRWTDAGDAIWQRTYDLRRNDLIRALTPLPDGSFLATGRCFSALGGQILLMRKNGDGD